VTAFAKQTREATVGFIYWSVRT